MLLSILLSWVSATAAGMWLRVLLLFSFIFRKGKFLVLLNWDHSLQVKLLITHGRENLMMIKETAYWGWACIWGLWTNGMLSVCFFILFYFTLFYYVNFSDSHLWHIKVPRLGVESELQLWVQATAMAMPDPSRLCDLRWILNPLSEARDRTHVFVDTGQVLNPLSHNGNFQDVYFKGIFVWDGRCASWPTIHLIRVSLNADLYYLIHCWKLCEEPGPSIPVRLF